MSARLYKIVYYGLFAALWTPLIIFRSFWSPTNFGKVIVFRILIEILAVFWLILVVFDKKFKPKFNLISWAFLFFVFSYFITGIFGANLGQSFWGGFERMGGIFNLIHYFIFFLMLNSVIRSKRDWLLILNLSLLIGVFSIAYGFLQLSNWQFILGALKSGARDRIFSTIGNPAMFAGYLLFIIYLALFLCFGNIYQFSRRRRGVYLVVAFLSSLALIMTAVRGAILALGISLLGFLFGLWYFRLRTSSLNKFRYKVIAVVILIILVLTSFYFFNTVKKSELVKKSYLLSRLVNTNLNQISIKQRLLVWGEAWNGFKAKPFLGWGPENFTLVHEKYFNPQVYYGSGGAIFDRAHNVFFDTLVTQGFVGLFSLVFLFTSIFIVLKKNLFNFPVAYYALFFLLVAYIIQDFFFFDTFSIYLMLGIVLAIISSDVIFGKVDEHDLATNYRHRKSIADPLIILVSLGSTLLIYFSFLSVKANNLSAKAAVNFSKSNYELGFNQWKKSLSYPLPASYRTDILLNVEPVFIDSLYKTSDSLTKEKIASDLDYLISQFTKSVQDNPGLIENYTGLNQLGLAYASFIDRGKFDDSIETLTQASKIGPNLIHVWLELGNIYGFKGDYPMAVKSFEQAYNLNLNYLPAGFLLARAYVANNQEVAGLNLAEDLFYRGYQNINDFLWLGGQLKTNGGIDRLIKLLEFMAQKDPNHLIYLAIAQKDAGNIKEAKEVADKMLNFEEKSVQMKISSANYRMLADLFRFFGDIKKRTRAFEKSGDLAPLP